MTSEDIKQLNDLLDTYKELLNLQHKPAMMIAGDENISDIIRLVEEQIKSYCEQLKTKEEVKKVAYICDEKQCENGHCDICHHTLDINHAKNFRKFDGVYEEKLDKEKNSELEELQKLVNIISNKFSIELYEQQYYIDDCNVAGAKFIPRLPLSKDELNHLRKHFVQLDYLLKKDKYND